MTSKDYLKQIAESKGVCPLTNEVKDNALLFPIGFEKIFQDLDRLEKLEQENQDLTEWCLILNRHLYIAPEMCELRMATPKNADFLIKNSSWTKYYNGIDVHEIDYKKFVNLYYSKIKEVLENENIR